MSKNTKKVDKAFISEIDKRLAKFDQLNLLTASQKAEIEKHKPIFKRRDKAINDQPEKPSLWD